MIRHVDHVDASTTTESQTSICRKVGTFTSAQVIGDDPQPTLDMTEQYPLENMIQLDAEMHNLKTNSIT
jgi:hypothetical protein